MTPRLQSPAFLANSLAHAETSWSDWFFFATLLWLSWTDFFEPAVLDLSSWIRRRLVDPFIKISAETGHRVIIKLAIPLGPLLYLDYLCYRPRLPRSRHHLICDFCFLKILSCYYTTTGAFRTNLNQNVGLGCHFRVAFSNWTMETACFQGLPCLLRLILRSQTPSNQFYWNSSNIDTKSP